MQETALQQHAGIMDIRGVKTLLYKEEENRENCSSII
jgi:hypothetical protein